MDVWEMRWKALGCSGYVIYEKEVMAGSVVLRLRLRRSILREARSSKVCDVTRELDAVTLGTRW